MGEMGGFLFFNERVTLLKEKGVAKNQLIFAQQIVIETPLKFNERVQFSHSFTHTRGHANQNHRYSLLCNTFFVGKPF